MWCRQSRLRWILRLGGPRMCRWRSGRPGQSWNTSQRCARLLWAPGRARLCFSFEVAVQCRSMSCLGASCLVACPVAAVFTSWCAHGSEGKRGGALTLLPLLCACMGWWGSWCRSSRRWHPLFSSMIWMPRRWTSSPPSPSAPEASPTDCQRGEGASWMDLSQDGPLPKCPACVAQDARGCCRVLSTGPTQGTAHLLPLLPC